MNRQEVLNILKKNNVSYMRLWFTDILGRDKNIEIPASQFSKALDGKIAFDGSSIKGFASIEKSDMKLMPDYQTLVVFPWAGEEGKVARLICDVCHSDGSPYEGCTRTVLKNVCAQALERGYVANIGAEAEFFLFKRDNFDKVTTNPHDAGDYFDLTPTDRGEHVRRAIVQALEKIGFEIEAAHHEVAIGQHEINFKYNDALTVADNIATYRFVVRKIALDFGLHATFMPKPLFGINGSGMHLNQSLFDKRGKNLFYDAQGHYQLSDLTFGYIGGLLEHASSFCAITNSLVNSYKRIVPGYEAPTHIAWSLHNRSPLIRVPDTRDAGTRVELRMPDPACNPYLALAVMFAAGLDGIKQKLDPGPSIDKNVYKMNEEERARLKIKSLPSDLGEALTLLEKNKLMREVLGEHVFHNFLTIKRNEWNRYISQVHQCELDWYLTEY